MNCTPSPAEASIILAWEYVYAPKTNSIARAILIHTHYAWATAANKASKANQHNLALEFSQYAQDCYFLWSIALTIRLEYLDASS